MTNAHMDLELIVVYQLILYDISESFDAVINGGRAEWVEVGEQAVITLSRQNATIGLHIL